MEIAYEDLDCCEDCLMYLANGDVPEERPNLVDDIRKEWPSWGTEFDLVIGGDETDEFSWSSCDCCGSRLGGARYKFRVLRLG
jgi:hypothetical protein